MANNTTTLAPTPLVYTVDKYLCSDIALILPLINEFTWSLGARAFLYLLGLFWCFLAVAIIADVFMCSIERITSKTRTLRVPDDSVPEGYREIKVRVWNDTVANLSLLALGTSAPEILLSVIEIVGNGMEAGDLGPGTIVGSASFNLLVITAICIVSIPEGEVRRVENLKVFAVTAISCILAYVWLAVVLLGYSPGQVDIGEAIITFLLFPTLIGIAYLVDRNFFIKKKTKEQPTEIGLALDMEEGKNLTDDQSGEASLIHLARDMSHKAHDDPALSEEEAAKIAAAKLAENESHDRGWYRINATRLLTGGRKLIPRVIGSFQELYERVQLPEDERDPDTPRMIDHTEGGTKSVLDFTAAAVAVMENEKKVRIGIKRYGRTDLPVSVRVETINGTALETEDYIPFNEEIKFAANELLRQIHIEIVDDFEWEPDEFFFVKMAPITSQEHCVLGNISICQVTIINDDEPGKLEFGKPSVVVKESMGLCGIPVQRIHGADGHVSVTWKTKDMTAVSGKDFKGGEGTLKFDHGELNKNIKIPIFESNKAERDESFQIELLECDGGAELGKINRCIITIVNDDEFNGLMGRIINMTKANLDALQLNTSTWQTQFREAMNVNGGDIETATAFDYFFHFLTFPWKCLFAFVPPPKYWGGWPAFLISLALIGLLTAIIGDLAGIFGCLIDLKPSVTAITLVALGTSMPDTFASKQAAVGEKTADSSVGNVNGSNSVNVFLGLGLPWLIATIYHLSKGSVFKVPTGDLGFSVILYTIAAIIAMTILILRRSLPLFGNAELGGVVWGKQSLGVVDECSCRSIFDLVQNSLGGQEVTGLRVGKHIHGTHYVTGSS
ncbi:hypothetical protein ScPMuIL_003732 [Solemya velum]